MADEPIDRCPDCNRWPFADYEPGQCAGCDAAMERSSWQAGPVPEGELVFVKAQPMAFVLAYRLGGQLRGVDGSSVPEGCIWIPATLARIDTMLRALHASRDRSLDVAALESAHRKTERPILLSAGASLAWLALVVFESQILAGVAVLGPVVLLVGESVLLWRSTRRRRKQ